MKTLAASASTTAREILEDIKYGRTRNVKFGSQIQLKKPPAKIRFKETILTTLLFVFSVFAIKEWYSKYTVNGFSALNGQGVLPNVSLEFHKIDSNEVYRVKSSRDGDFSLRLTKGTYKVCSKDENFQKDYRNPKTTPIRVKIEQNISLRLGFDINK